MSQQPQYPDDPRYVSSGYPPQQNQFSPDEYKAHYDDLADGHKTFAVEAGAFGSPTKSPGLQQKQSYSSEYSGKDTEESFNFPPPRSVPMKQPKEVDTRTFWQKVSLSSYEF